MLKENKIGLIAPMVGKLAYGIWKALHARENKKEQNLKSFEENGNPYEQGKKVENFDLVIKDVAESSFSYSRWAPTQYSKLLICEDPKTGFKVKVKLGKNDVSNAIFSLFFDIKGNPEIFQSIADSLPEFEKMKNIKISGTISKVNPEYKSVSINYVKINSPTAEEVHNFIGLLYDKKNELAKKKEEEKAAAKNESSTLQITKGMWDQFGKNVIKNLQDWLDGNETDEKRIETNLNVIKSSGCYKFLTDDEKEIYQKAEEKLNKNS